MSEYSYSEGPVTHIYTEDGYHIVEYDEPFADLTPAEMEDWEETIRRIRSPIKRKLLRMRVF